MIERRLTSKLREMASKFPVVTLTGPRQSGKSTLLRNCFPDYKYVSLEDIDNRQFATDDPRGFLATYPDKTIIDEAQRVPTLFSYIQTHTDKIGNTGMYMLAGSHNFLLMESINQSLAGRTAILKLLPFSHEEMKDGGIFPPTPNAEIFTGGYPRIFDKGISPTDFYPNYTQTYVERDVRLLKNIGNITLFERFLKLCAGRIGNILNLSTLASDCGITVPTATAWMSVLEASYICFLLKPDFNNFAKRLVKAPKLYFYDTGLASSLLDISNAEQIGTHFLRGGLFENMVISEILKRHLNCGQKPDLRYWRDSTGMEVDLLDYTDGNPTAYEIKAGETFATDYFKNIVKWATLSGTTQDKIKVIYAGDRNLATSSGEVVAWDRLNRMYKEPNL